MELSKFLSDNTIQIIPSVNHQPLTESIDTQDSPIQSLATTTRQLESVAPEDILPILKINKDSFRSDWKITDDQVMGGKS